ncbi:hypothetical protein [Allocoleopsis sp.]|uniref:hypothetical protein n=1 Tax=Allocoleopsis sp. TaxID=3088169 RepID=UPI002FCFE9C2
MGYNSEQWYSRIANRSDITNGVTHLTKPSFNIKNLTDEDEINQLATENLIEILKDRVIRGSTTEKGFIVGKTPAVCFQDVPFYSLIQNIEHERQRRSANPNERYRYCGVGIAFFKPYIFRKGGRPVFYDQIEIAKKLLPQDQHWRIVNFDISDHNKIIDWTHEREWRLPIELKFELNKTHILLYNQFC